MYVMFFSDLVMFIIYSPEGEYWKYFTRQKNGVDAFGYNSAESEPI